MSIRTVKVSNISLDANEWDIKEFFSFSGDIQYIEMQSESEKSQLAYVTFKDSQGADTAKLLSGATIVNLSVTVTPVENYQLPPEASAPNLENKTSSGNATVKKAEDMVSSMLAKGFILGKDALKKAKAFDEQHHLTSNASAKVVLLDQKMGLSAKISVGTAVLNEKMKEVNEQYQVSEKTKSAFTVAEQKASSARSAIMSNPYVSTGALWVSNALNKVSKAAEDVTLMTKEKLERAEGEKLRKETNESKKMMIVNDFLKMHHEDDEASGKEPLFSPDDSSETTTNKERIHHGEEPLEREPKVDSVNDSKPTS